MTDQNVETKMCYIAYEKNWQTKPCPECGKPATAHGFLSWEEITPENRKAFGHVYMHPAPAEDCVVAGSKYL